MSTYQTATRGMQPATPRRRNGSKNSTSEAAVEAHKRVSVSISGAEGSPSGPLARVIINLPDGTEVDATRTIVAALAHALWERRGADHLTNWLDAEAVLNEVLSAKQPPVTKARAGRVIQAAPAVEDDDLLSGHLLPRRIRSRRL